MPSWRYRRCPRCGQVFPASEFAIVDLGPNWHREGPGARRQCAGCGAVGPTRAFPVVRDPQDQRDLLDIPMTELLGARR
jgi:hypothetical protein